jgi:hypothetical protein
LFGGEKASTKLDEAIKKRGLASGGDVPMMSRYMGDGYGPVMLDAGESVLDRTTAQRLNRFLDSAGGGQQPQTVNVTLQVGEKELSNVILDLNRRGYRLA